MGWLTKWFKPKEETDRTMKYLIVGLGNIGSEYRHTRHNAGFLIVEALADHLGATFQEGRYGAMAQASFKGRKLWLLKPNTYMNRSGQAIRYWLDKEKSRWRTCWWWSMSFSFHSDNCACGRKAATEDTMA